MVSPVEPETISDGTTLAITSHSHICQERLRQAHLSFNLAFGLTAASSTIVLTGVLLFLSGHVPAAAVATAIAFMSGDVCKRWENLTKEANDRLDKTAKTLEDKSRGE